MLSFPSNLSNALIGRNNQAYWYIKLYYGDESSFTGLSDRDRTIDSVKYRGLVKSWGTLVQSVDLFALRAGTLAMNGLTLVNVHDTIEGGRFTDLFASQNYINRKWTLHMGAVGVAVADHVQIGQGIITDQIEQGTDQVTLQLLEDLKNLSIEVPTTRVNTTDHPNAPERNIGKPIPMAYGDFGQATDVGTIPSSGSEFDRYYQFVKGAFPSPITDKYNQLSARVDTSPDSVTLNDLDPAGVGSNRSKNIFMYKDNEYISCEDSNTYESETDPLVSFTGSGWRVYIPLNDHDTYSGQTGYANGTDGDFSTEFNIGDRPVLHDSVFGWKLGKVPKLGEFTSIKVICELNNFVDGGADPNPTSNTYGFQFESDLLQTNESEITWNGGNQSIDISDWFTTTQKDAWDFETDILMEIQDTATAAECDCSQVGVEIAFVPSQTFEKQYNEPVAQGLRFAWNDSGNIESFPPGVYLIPRKVQIPQIGDYIYYSGKGREFGAWVDADSRSNGYDKGDLIENPVYMIEDILRTELGTKTTGTTDATSAGSLLDSTATFTSDMVGQSVRNTTDGTFTIISGFSSSTALTVTDDIFVSGDGYVISGLTSNDIDYSSFDTAGNTTNGALANVFNDTIADIKYAWCQYKFIGAWELCQEIAGSSGLICFYSGDGKVKIVVRQRDEDYTSSDKSIDYSAISNIKPGLTPLGNVRNKTSVRYNMDYATDTIQTTTPVSEDATSQGDGEKGYTITQELIQDNRFILNSTTAENYSDALLDWLAYQKKTLNFNVATPAHNDLEIGDTISFTNWDSNFKIYGNSIGSTDIYMITQISKTPHGCTITAQEVSEVGD